MNWPTKAFADPDLQTGELVVNLQGQPLAKVGKNSSVLQVIAPDERSWAVKCYTRPVADLGPRYARLSEALDAARLPETVGFRFLEQGIRVGDAWQPVLKMDWVEGHPLNRAVQESGDDRPAMEALFRSWCQLCKRMRDAGIAHGDLQHGNVLIVPNEWEGKHDIKLIDYDGMFAPSLADLPSSEVGHPNYQHPARPSAKLYSADLDRFSHLVIGTALKGVAVLGSKLWVNYDTGDNLLFKADDFREPDKSALMQELWQAGDLELQALVGQLALACRRTLSQTPWLDEIAPDGAVQPLSPAKARSAAAALGLSSPAPVPIDVDVVYDDASARPPAKAPAEPRDPPTAKRAPRKSMAALVPLAAVLGFLMIVCSGIGGVIAAVMDRPTQIVQAPPETNPTPPTKPTPPDTKPSPPDTKPTPPAVPVKPGFHKLWAKPAGNATFLRPFVAKDGKHAFVITTNQVDVYETKTGNDAAQLRGPSVPQNAINIWSFDKDAFGLYGFPIAPPTFWDANTGNPLPPSLAPDVLPTAPAGTANSLRLCEVSPDRRFAFFGFEPRFQNQTFAPAPYRIVELATGRVLRDGNWQNGCVRFTADGNRMLMAETSGKLRWFSLPNAEATVEWKFEPFLFAQSINGLSADGSLILFHGQPVGQPLALYLLDGRTGQPLRTVSSAFTGGRGTLTADGRWINGVILDPQDRRQYAVVTDARTGATLVKTPVEGAENAISQAVSQDGRTILLHDRRQREVIAYELRGDVPPTTDPIPPPIGLAPETRVPADVAILPPVQPPVVPPPVQPPIVPPRPPVVIGPVLTPARAIEPAWAVKTETDTMSNTLPQTPLYSKDGATLILAGGKLGTILTFDVKARKAGPTFTGHNNHPAGVYWLQPFDNTKVLSAGFDVKPTTWDTRTGKAIDPIKLPDLPPLAEGRNGHAGITVVVSPSGRFTVQARLEAAAPPVAGPLRVLDTTTGNEIVKADWSGGAIRFTADESRLMLMDHKGNVKWHKLPTGEADGGWQPAESRFSTRLLSMSGDGSKMLFQGVPAVGELHGNYLVDGKTGRVIRKLPTAPYQSAFCTLSPDGRFVAMLIVDFKAKELTAHADIFEAETWKLLGRVSPPEGGSRTPPQMAFSPDGTELAIYYPTVKELRVASVPDAGGAIAPPVDVGRIEPLPAGVLTWKARWDVPTGVARQFVPELVPFRYDAEAGLVVLRNQEIDGVAAINARTGQGVPQRVEGMQWTAAGTLQPLSRGRLGYHYRTDAAVSVWDLKAGKAGDPIPVPDVPPGPDRTNHRFVQLTEDGAYMAVARYSPAKQAAPFRVFEMATGKAVLSTEWVGGAVFFTADASRMLIADANGKCRWFKLPTGEADGEWNLPKVAPGAQPVVSAISGDGKFVAFTHKSPEFGKIPSPAIVDGKTGEVKTQLDAAYLGSSPVSLSADGKLAAAIRRANPPGSGAYHIDIVTVDGGKVVGRATVLAIGTAPLFALSPDGKALIVHNAARERMMFFEVPVAPPAGVAPPEPPRGGPRPAVGAAPNPLAPRWNAEVAGFDSISNIHANEWTVFLSNVHANRFLAVDVITGVSKPSRVDGLRGTPAGDLFPLSDGRVGILHWREPSVTVWFPHADKAGDAIRVPEVPHGRAEQHLRTAKLSPDGKYFAAGRRGLTFPPALAPFRVVELATGKAVVSTEWLDGAIFFTADSSRVLIAESDGRCRWFKLPSGEPDGEWAMPGRRPGRRSEFTDISGDGKLVGYSGVPLGPEQTGVYVLDGKTGDVKHAFGDDYFYTSPVSLSADGKLAAVMRKGDVIGSDSTIDVIELARNAVVARVMVTTRNRSIPTFQLTKDGKALLVHDYSQQRLYWYDLPVER